MKYLQSNLAGLVETVVLDDSYHIVTLDRQRHVVVDRTLDFVARTQQFAGSLTAIDEPSYVIG
jgi:carboxylesterase